MAAKTRAPKRGAKDAPRKGKKKVCIFCADKVEWVDYKDINLLRRFQSDRGKIRARRVTGNCNQHQNEVANAIKTARELALLPYSQRTVTENRERRGGRGPGGRRDDNADDMTEDLVDDDMGDDAQSADDEAVDAVMDAAAGDGGDEGGDE